MRELWNSLTKFEKISLVLTVVDVPVTIYRLQKKVAKRGIK